MLWFLSELVTVCPPVPPLQPDFLNLGLFIAIPHPCPRGPRTSPPSSWLPQPSTHLFLLLSSALQLPDFPRPPAHLCPLPSSTSLHIYIWLFPMLYCQFVLVALFLFCLMVFLPLSFVSLYLPASYLSTCLSTSKPCSAINLWSHPAVCSLHLDPTPCSHSPANTVTNKT